MFPILLKRYVNKKKSQFNQQFNHQKNTNVEEEGKVTIKSKPKKSKPDTSDMGDYVDFEEVDE